MLFLFPSIPYFSASLCLCGKFSYSQTPPEIPIGLEKLETRKAKIEKALEELRVEKARLKKEVIGKKSKDGKEGVLSKKEEEKIEKSKINLTDFDAKYMKEREGCIKTNYNAQGSVDEKSQFILYSARA